MATEWHVPERPYSPIDSLNRRAAALGSPRYAQLTSYADYNGHRVTVSYNDYRGYYVAEYFWAGRVVLARGSFEGCLEAALREHARGALGSSVVIAPRDGDADAIARCDAHPLVRREPEDRSWYTWRHAVAARCAPDAANPRAGHMIFDWPLLEAAQTEAEYETALKAKYGQSWRR